MTLSLNEFEAVHSLEIEEHLTTLGKLSSTGDILECRYRLYRTESLIHKTTFCHICFI